MMLSRDALLPGRGDSEAMYGKIIKRYYLAVGVLERALFPRL